MTELQVILQRVDMNRLHCSKPTRTRCLCNPNFFDSNKTVYSKTDSKKILMSLTCGRPTPHLNGPLTSSPHQKILTATWTLLFTHTPAPPTHTLTQILSVARFSPLFFVYPSSPAERTLSPSLITLLPKHAHTHFELLL